MSVEVKETVFGRTVPQYLLNFTGTSTLQQYYRDLLKRNYGKGFDKIDLGQCATCHSVQTVNDQPRLKSLPRMTKKIHRLLVKQSSGKQLGKYSQHILKKYLQSKQQMIVKCSKCLSINRMDLMSREDLIVMRAQHLRKVKLKDMQPLDKEPRSTKRKKRKKKQQKFAKNSLIPIENNNDHVNTNMSSANVTATESPKSSTQNKKTASLQDLIKPSPKQNKSSLLQKSMGTFNSKVSENKKTVSKQRQLKAFLKDSLTSEKTASLSDFLSSL